MSLGKLVVELSLDDNEFTMELKKADGLLEKFIKSTASANQRIDRVSQSTRNWGSSLHSLVVTTALIREAIRTVSDVTIGWQKAIIDVNADMQRSIALMKNFSTASTAAAATQEAMADTRNLLNKAANSPFSLNAITDSFVKLRVSGIKPVNESFSALTDAVAAFGGSDENLKRASVAIQQMAGKGVVSMEELRQQLGEAVPTAIQNMADGLGTTYADLVKQISQGKVKSEPAVMAMMRQMEVEFKGSAENMMNTWQGAVNQISNSTTQLALAFGGFNEGGGYGEGSYMATLVEQLRQINDLMKDPDMVRSAQDFGHAMADVVKNVADAIKWVIQYRSEIGEVLKVTLELVAVYKGLTWGRAAMNAAIPAITGLVAQLNLIRTNSVTAGAAVQTLLGQSNQATRALELMGGGAGRAGLALRGVTAALGFVTGPIGMVAAAVVTGMYAWNQYRESVNKAREELLKVNGVGAGQKGLELLTSELQRMKETFNDTKKGTVGLAGTFTSDAERQRYITEESAKIRQMEEAVANARKGVMEEQGEAVANAQKRQLGKEFDDYQLVYKQKLAELRKTRDAEVAAGDKDASSKFQKGLLGLDTDLLQKRLDAVTAIRDQYQEMLDASVESNRGNTQNQTAIDNINQLRGTLKLLNKDVEDGQKDMDRLIGQRQSLTDPGVMIGGGGPGKFVFDPLQKFVDQQTLTLAKLRAGAEETNPVLEQFNQIIENMDATGQSSKRIAELRAQIAKVAPEIARLQEEAKKIKGFANDAKDATERLRQIDLLTIGKTAKAQNDNPWEKASADAQRYYQELKDLRAKLTSERDEALKMGDNGAATKAAQSLNEVIAKLPSAEAALQRLTVVDAAQSMTEKTRSIRDSLLTQTELTEQEYQRQRNYAEDYFANHQQMLTQDTVAYKAYQDYLTALDLQHNRDTESGLQAWVRTNKDASEKYKSVWTSAMDGFVDTLVDGLAEGKMNITSWVEDILKQLMKVMIAKQMAAAVDSGSGILGSIGSAIGSYFGAGSAAAGSTGTTASSTSSFSLGSNVSGGGSNGTLNSFKFANGGIMTEYGSLALRKYANGGVANRPQLALYGEGSKPEAYVPLPDGRTIPVTLSGVGGATNAAPQQSGKQNVQVNVYNQSGQQMDADSKQSFDGEKYVVDIVLKNIQRPGAMRDAVKGAK